MKILVFGATGQIARRLMNALPPLGNARFLSRETANLEDGDALRGAISAWRPDIVINAAAYTDVEKAEMDSERAWAINATALRHIGAAAAAVGALVIHFSTDYVYRGEGSLPQDENAPLAPASVYAKSKLAGEVALAETGARHAIFRTSWVFDAEGVNFPTTILRLALTREELTVVADQTGAPTSAALIASTIAGIIPRLFGDPDYDGVYNLSAGGETSWFEFARFLTGQAQEAGARLSLTQDRIKPISAEQYGAKAPRPLNSRLDTGKLRKSFGIDPPDWREDSVRLIAALRASGRL